MIPAAKRCALVLLAAAAAALAAPPDAATVGRLVLAALPKQDLPPSAVEARGFVEGDEPGELLAAVRVGWEYYDEVYAALFVADEGEWTLAPLGDPFTYSAQYGDGDAGTITKTPAGDRTYYAFSCTEASYGTGMGTEYDYYTLYRIRDDELVAAFEGDTRNVEVVFERWYGGEDTTAWSPGGYNEIDTRYSFADVDGDGVRELWATSESREVEDGPPGDADAKLYAAAADGTLAPAPMDRFRAPLEAAGTEEAYLALAGAALRDEGDAALARGYLEKAAALAPDDAGLGDRMDLLGRMAKDPPAAVALYFGDAEDNLRTVMDRYPKSEAAAQATVAIGDLRELLAFLGEKKDHPRWAEAYAGAVLEALYTFTYEEDRPVTAAELAALRKHLSRYLEETPDGAARADVLSRLADCYYKAGDFKAARKLFVEALAADGETVFADYDYLRLGDCAAAAGDNGAAIDNYLAALARDGWWSADAADQLAGYATLAEGDTARNFADAMDERGRDDFLYAAGDLDGDGDADLGVVATGEDEKGRRADELYYFLRTGSDFRGRLVKAGAIFWWPEVTNLFGDGAALLGVKETIEAPGGRTGYQYFFRYDGREMREAARVLVERRGQGGGDESPAAAIAFQAGTPPSFAVSPAPAENGAPAAASRTYVWDEASFTFKAP